MQKNQEFELEITDLGDAGEGIGHFEGMAVFVPGALPGDRILAGATKVKKKYAFARLISRISDSKDRVTSACPVSDKCGGCSLMSFDYKAQLRLKENRVKEDLIRIGGFPKELIEEITEPIIGMDEPFRYRNKSQYPVGIDRDGNVITGFFAPHSHRIVPCEDCLIGNERDREILSIVKSWITQNDIPVYDEFSGKGLIRHILLRHGHRTDGTTGTMVCLVANGDDLPHRDSLISDLQTVPEVKSVCLNINLRRDNVILGSVTKVIWGSEYIIDESLGFAFQISAASFFQVNPEQTKHLYGKAISYAGLTGSESVWDLYCGTGTIGICMSKDAGEVFGVEIVPQAIEDAKSNAKRNGIENISFMAGAAEEVMPEYYSKSESRPDVVVVDPPRKGCDPTLLSTIISAAPKRIVYVSCNPSTLARDLRILADGGYELKKACPVDMFANSMGVETVVQLVNIGVKPDYTVRLEVDVDEFYKTVGEEKRHFVKPDQKNEKDKKIIDI